MTSEDRRARGTPIDLAEPPPVLAALRRTQLCRNSLCRCKQEVEVARINLLAKHLGHFRCDQLQVLTPLHAMVQQSRPGQRTPRGPWHQSRHLRR